jgi:hypothetical protein
MAAPPRRPRSSRLAPSNYFVSFSHKFQTNAICHRRPGQRRMAAPPRRPRSSHLAPPNHIDSLDSQSKAKVICHRQLRSATENRWRYLPGFNAY